MRVRIPAGAAGEFSSLGSTSDADSYSVSIPSPCYRSGALKTLVILPKVRWQVTPKQAYTFDLVKSEWADYAAVHAQCGNLSRNELTRNSSGNTRSQWSQLAEPLWTEPGLTSEISVRELISTLKKSTGRE